MFYAFNYPAGLNNNSNGERYGSYHQFATKHARDEFVTAGNADITGPDYREAIPSTDRELRGKLALANRHCKHGSSWEQSLWEAGINL